MHCILLKIAAAAALAALLLFTGHERGRGVVIPARGPVARPIGPEPPIGPVRPSI